MTNQRVWCPEHMPPINVLGATRTGQREHDRTFTAQEGHHLDVGEQAMQARSLRADAPESGHIAWHFQINPFQPEVSVLTMMVGLICQHGNATAQSFHQQWSRWLTSTISEL